jgi:hypothetical protein
LTPIRELGRMPTQADGAKLRGVSLEYASGHLIAAVTSLASSERPLQERLQLAWDENVQMLWMKPCLTSDLLCEFRDFWHRYTARSDDATSTALRLLSEDELKCAIDELAVLSTRTTVTAAQSPDGVTRPHLLTSTSAPGPGRRGHTVHVRRHAPNDEAKLEARENVDR